MASIKDLQDQMNKNSQAWHGANKAEQDRLHKENERLQSQIDSMTGGSSTFNPGTGKWSTTGGSSASRPSGVGGSRPSGGSSSRPSGGNWSTGSNGYGSSYGTDASGQNDYSVLIRDAMNAGASADEVQRLLDQRVNKAQQSGYNQYMYDDLYHAAQNYIKQQTQLPQVEDYSDYLADAFAAQKRAALAQINNAYQQNVNAITRAGEGVDTRYQNARNQAAGASELAARNFNEYAAAAGLNSGAGGQAELVRNVALQNNLNDLSTAEAQTYADLEQQMANAEVEYNNAIAEAEANGDAALASALYQEKVRVQQANMEALMQQYQMDLQKQQLQYQQKQDAASSALAERQQMAQYGNTFLEMGLMPSQEMLDAMGITAADAQAYINQLSLQASLTAAGGRSGNAGRGTGGTTGSGTVENVSAPTSNAGGSVGGSQVQGNNSEWSGIDMSSVTALGYGPVSRAYLEQMVDSGQVEAYQDPATGLIKFRRGTTSTVPSRPSFGNIQSLI